MRRSKLLRSVIVLFLLPYFAYCLECDPTSNVKKADPANPESYLYCNLEGTFSKRKCVPGKVFNSDTGDCEHAVLADDPSAYDIFSQPYFQAPDDICGAGLPLTILSAPVACNPSISSCPDGYVCRMYEKTGSSYCCQNISPNKKSNEKVMCGEGRVTYVEMISGRPRSCALSNEASCPSGFSCTLIGGTTTRCCANDMGCPINSAPQVRTNSGSHVECSPSGVSKCETGFVCMRSSLVNKFICCSNPDGELQGSCPGGEDPLDHPPCTSTHPCPTGFVCNEGKCCPSAGVCPTGNPLGGTEMSCGDYESCPDGHTCVTTNGLTYCCPSKEKVCSLQKNIGATCSSKRTSVTKYYFDTNSSTCRPFKFSQCGGNENRFNSLEECEGFCIDTQCPNGQAFRVGAVNAACSLDEGNTCPKQHFCQQPLFGPTPICCPTSELTCNEMVSAGTPCFGHAVTFHRYYFNPSTQKCQAFQYYGCNGNGNNFETVEQCQHFCVNSAESVCGGLAPLMDPNQEAQRCSENVPCPSGYDCNESSFCCPTTQTSCNAKISQGNSCKGATKKSMWYYDKEKKKCSQFVFNGCGGTANRFNSRTACNDACMHSGVAGSCPRGMTPFSEDETNKPISCTLNVAGTCPSGSSCVRSTTNRPICCQAVTSCPNNRTPYIIPGSNSVVACQGEEDCPDSYKCLESSTAPGFHMCCSTTVSSSQRPIRPRNKQKPTPPDTFAELLRKVSPCPPQLLSSGKTCTVNAIGDCPSNHICFRDVGYEQGSCCRTVPPKCAQKGFIPVFLEKTQVQICQIDIGGCPSDSRCMTSTVAKLSICCKKYQPPQPPSNRPTINSGSSERPNKVVCANGQTPFMANNEMKQCNFIQNTCPTGYQCEFSSTGQAVCCKTAQAETRCPAGTSGFEFGGRPLACPPGSNKCPMGFACVASTNPQYHLCCSSATAGLTSMQPQCARGVAYVNPVTNQRQFCSPIGDDCPAGYHCFESDVPTKFICCTHGYCPTRQIPYVSRDGFPSSCHMQLAPCPTTAPYVCIYSPEKQDSFCCAPIDTAVRTLIPDNYAASPMKKLGAYGDRMTGDQTQQMNNLPLASFTQPPVAIPDPIPGVDRKKVLPADVLKAEAEKEKLIEHFKALEIQNLAKKKFDVSKLSNPTSGCPLGSQPLFDATKMITECSNKPCPEGFSCVFAEKENRFQCCSSSSIMLAMGKPKQPVVSEPRKEEDCPPGHFFFNDKCLKIMFAGQKGCTSDEQCSNREPNATCDSGYCICPTNKPLVHGGRCIASCPEGFSNIAGRCYDPTTVIFMDSVDERSNGTIGGYCLDTLIEEKRCSVKESYCSEKTITCQCQAGYELEMNFENKDDAGTCKKIEGSKFTGEQVTPPPIDDELYFIDISSMRSDGLDGNSTDSETEDLSKYLFQADDLVPVFA